MFIANEFGRRIQPTGPKPVKTKRILETARQCGRVKCNQRTRTRAENLVAYGFLVHLGGEYYGATLRTMALEPDDINATIRNQNRWR